MAAKPKLRSGQSSLLSHDLLTYYRRLSHSRLTVVDVETTGTLAYKSRVIEVSVLQASLKEGIRRQQTYLINPQMRIPWPITKVTGITQEMVNQGSFDVWAIRLFAQCLNSYAPFYSPAFYWRTCLLAVFLI